MYWKILVTKVYDDNNNNNSNKNNNDNYRYDDNLIRQHINVVYDYHLDASTRLFLDPWA